jgi:outer membrane beta-barrel protein
MENWHQRVLLAPLLAFALNAQAQDPFEQPQRDVVSPEVERREINPAAIDREDFEVGAYVGLMSIEDFDADFLWGARFAWHVTEDFFFEAAYGATQGDQTSFEDLSGGAPLFDDTDRDYSFYNLSVGWNALPGEIFLFDRAHKSDLYMVLGAGSTDFLDDNWFTVNFGVGYRLLVNDWLAWRLDVRDHMFDRDTFGDDETTHNVELSTGLTVFF